MSQAPNVDVDAKHKDYTGYLPEWNMITACIKGEREVKAAGTLYLPNPSTMPSQPRSVNDRALNAANTAKYQRAVADRTARYNDYKMRAAFLNATGRTAAAMLGIAFNVPPVIDLQGQLTIFKEDVDRSKQPIDQMVRDAVTENLQHGRFGLFPDYSVPTEFDDTGAPVERSVEQAAQARPLIRLFYAEQIINWRVTDGVTTLVVAKYKDTVDDPIGFSAQEVTVWLELRLIKGVAHARRWYQNQSEYATAGSTGITQTKLVPILDIDGNQMDSLPWAWGGAVNNDAFPDSPPLADIASLNIKHYMAEADIAEHAHIVGQAMPVITGLTQAWADKNLAGGIQFGARVATLLPVGADMKLIQAEERTASTLLAERREKQMAMIGASLVAKGEAPKTATEAEYDAQTDNSILSLCVGNVESAFNAALKIAAQFAGGSGTIKLNRKFVAAQLDAQLLTTMMAGVQVGTIRLSDFIKWMMAQGVIDETEDISKVEDELRNADPFGQQHVNTVQYDANGDPIDPNNPQPKGDPNGDQTKDNTGSKNDE